MQRQALPSRGTTYLAWATRQGLAHEHDQPLRVGGEQVIKLGAGMNLGRMEAENGACWRVRRSSDMAHLSTKDFAPAPSLPPMPTCTTRDGALSSLGARTVPAQSTFGVVEAEVRAGYGRARSREAARGLAPRSTGRTDHALGSRYPEVTPVDGSAKVRLLQLAVECEEVRGADSCMVVSL